MVGAARNSFDESRSVQLAFLNRLTSEHALHALCSPGQQASSTRLAIRHISLTCNLHIFQFLPRNLVTVEVKLLPFHYLCF